MQISIASRWVLCMIFSLSFNNSKFTFFLHSSNFFSQSLVLSAWEEFVDNAFKPVKNGINPGRHRSISRPGKHRFTKTTSKNKSFYWIYIYVICFNNKIDQFDHIL